VIAQNYERKQSLGYSALKGCLPDLLSPPGSGVNQCPL